MIHLLADVRYALRSLRKAPLFTAVAVTSIALGIGANTAVFTLLDQVVLRLLPVRQAGEIVQVAQSDFFGGKMGDGSEMSYPMYRDLRDHNESFSGMFAEFQVPLQVRVGSAASRINGELVSGTFFPVLGVQAAQGRLFTPDDDKVAGGHPVVVLSYAFWQSRFGSNPNIVGQSLNVNGNAMTVVGVVQAGFDGLDIGSPVQMYIPIAMQAQFAPEWLKLEDRGFGWVRAYGRLKPGVTSDAAHAALQPVYQSLLKTDMQLPNFSRASAETKNNYARSDLQVRMAGHGRSGLREQVERPLWVLMAVVGGVLLIACANVANLLLARASGRQREVALRLALGASRSRIVQQLLVESIVLAGAGCLAGVLLASWGATFLLQFFADPENPLPISASPDARVLAFTIAVSAISAVLFGLVPAVQATKPRLAETLKNQAQSVVGGHSVLRKSLVVAQVALSLLLLIGAGLFLRSLNKLLSVETGMTTNHLVAFSLDPGLAGYKADRSKQVAQDLVQRLNAVPGVRSAGYSFVSILGGGAWGMTVSIEGEHLRPSTRLFTLCNAISPDYFATMGMTMVAGRNFRESDARTGARVEGWPYRVGVVNETFVKRYFGQANPIGRHIGFGDAPGTPTPIEIVGIVKDAKYRGLREEPTPQLFTSYLEANDVDGLAFYVRTTVDPDKVPGLLAKAVRDLDPNLPVTGMRSLEDIVGSSLTNERLVASLSSIFSLLATVLAAVGLYGVMAYSVARRTREIGIRVALGAATGNVVWRVFREAGMLVVAGLAIGLPMAWWLTRYVQSQLYGVLPGDPLTMTAAGLGLALVAALAVLIPARRAAQIDPVSALRTE